MILLLFICLACHREKKERSIELAFTAESRDSGYYKNQVMVKNGADSDWNFRIADDSILVYDKITFFRNGEGVSPFTDYFHFDKFVLRPDSDRTFTIYTVYDFSDYDSIKIRLNEGEGDYLLKKSD